MKIGHLLAASSAAALLAPGLMLLSTAAQAQTTAPASNGQGPTDPIPTGVPTAGGQGPADQAQTSGGSTTSPRAAEAESEPAQNGGGEDVVVTGSRIRSPGGKLSQAVPVESVSAAELLGSRGDVALGDALNQLPQFRSTLSQANSTATIGTAGLNELDLRGLGTSRTLTLVNGRRVVTAAPGAYTPDVNTIPSDLLERVDVVTGGNSAIYGSDAVAGVVNFVLRRDFEGLRVRAQAGETTYGDRGSYIVAATAGHNFDDGKMNITAEVQYNKTDPLFYSDRSYLGAYSGTPGFITTEITTAPNRNFDGIPNAQFVPGGITFGSISTGSYVLATCPAANSTNAAQRSIVCTGQLTPTGGRIAYNFAFQPDGTLVRDDQAHGLVDNRAIGGGVLGGLSATGVENAMLDPGLDEVLGTLLFHADLSDAFKPFAEGTFAHVNALQQSTQPTFISSTLNGVFSINNPFLSTQARSLLVSESNPGATTFQIQRFNNDIGTRAENHSRDTYRAVLGVEGDISRKGNLHYEVAFNYGRTENFYATGGNVLIANYNKATNAVLAPANYGGTNFVLNSAGQRVVCAVNGDAITTNDDAGCYPLNVFGYGAGDARAVNYVLYRSTRRQWAQEVDGTAVLTGDTGAFFKLPGGPIAAVLGGEYRQEKAYSAYDPTTAAGLTFLNGSAPFAPPGVDVKEVFGELRVPLLADLPFIRELTFDGAGRVSDYGGTTGSVTAWNAGVTYTPVRDFSLKASYARSVRAPNLSNLYATPAVTYATITDPCDQPGGTNSANNITNGPNRARNCAAAGVPTTLTYTDSSGTIVSVPWTNVEASTAAGSNQGNPNLTPEIGYDFTVAGTFTPHMIPGLSFGATYYNIRVKNVISGLTGQQIVNRCYDDPGGINNPFCAAVFRRSGTGSTLTDFTFNGETSRVVNNLPNVTLPLAGNGLAFINQPFNFAQLTTRGIDVEALYRHTFMNDLSLTYHLTISYILDRLSYSYISDPSRYDRIDSTLGDPKWQGAFNIQAHKGKFDFSYNLRYIGKQIVSGLSYETFYASQGRAPLNPEARPFIYYDPVVYHNFRVGVDATEKYRLYVGVDNATNELPPYEIAGTGSVANGDSIYPNVGRFLYAGVEVKLR